MVYTNMQVGEWVESEVDEDYVVLTLCLLLFWGERSKFSPGDVHKPRNLYQGWVIKVIPFTTTSESDTRCHLL